MSNATSTEAPITHPKPTIKPWRNDIHMYLHGRFRILMNSSFLSFFTSFVSSLTSFARVISVFVVDFVVDVVVDFVGMGLSYLLERPPSYYIIEL